MKGKFFILTILSLIIAFNVNAKEMKNTPQVEGYKVKFKEIDKNGKGYIEEKTYIKYHDKQWKLIDSMEEDFITKEEFVGKCMTKENCNPKYKEKIFDEMDFNADGKLTKEEYKLKRKVEFKTMDKDDNGKLSEYEYVDGKKMMKEKFKLQVKTPNMQLKEKYKYEMKN